MLMVLMKKKMMTMTMVKATTTMTMIASRLHDKGSNPMDKVWRKTLQREEKQRVVCDMFRNMLSAFCLQP